MSDFEIMTRICRRYKSEKHQLEAEIDRLAAFLLQHYPYQIGEGNPERGESAVDVAIRLLTPDREEGAP